jgi:hypothetical protein
MGCGLVIDCPAAVDAAVMGCAQWDQVVEVGFAAVAPVFEHRANR